MPSAAWQFRPRSPRSPTYRCAIRAPDSVAVRLAGLRWCSPRQSRGCVWNLHAYGDAWPLNVVAGGADRPRDWHVLTQVLRPIFIVNVTIFDGMYNAGLAPLARLDERPEGFVAATVAVALADGVADRAHRVRTPGARALRGAPGGLLPVDLPYAVPILGRRRSIEVDFGAPHFGGYAARLGRGRGHRVHGAARGRRWLAAAAVGALTLALVLAVS